MSAIVARILERIGEPRLLELLTERISGTELNSLLLEVFDRKAATLTAPSLLKLYQQNRFVKPSDLPVIELKRMELKLLEIFQEFSFEPLELSPVAALGSCSTVAPADQKKILSALRGCEVMADATNAVALHISDLKKRRQWKPKSPRDKLQYATVQRHVRTQAIHVEKFTPHFKIACLVTSGTDSGNLHFERTTLNDHIAVMTSLFVDFYRVEEIKFRFLCRAGYDQPFEIATNARDFIVETQPGTRIEIIERPEKEIGYYKGIQYKIDIRVRDNWYEIGDGGFVDWTQQLLQNKKERMFTTGIGFDFMYRILQGEV